MCDRRYVPRNGRQVRCDTCRAWLALSKIDGRIWTAPPTAAEAEAARAVIDRG